MKLLKVLTLLVAILSLTLVFASCDQCKHKNQETLPVIDATCTSDGVSQIMCSDCGEIVKIEKVASTGHKEVVSSAVDPTCEQDGLTEGRVCSVCNEVFAEQIL